MPHGTCKNVAEYWGAETLSEVAFIPFCFTSHLFGGVCKLPAVEQMNVGDQLMTLTVCRALRTSLDEAILVMSGMIPADILGKEINMLYHARHMEGHTERTNAKRSESNDISQRR